ncbi:hypothetical protein ACFL6I_08585 [candidate division KSB1 bacterium]
MNKNSSRRLYQIEEIYALFKTEFLGITQKFEFIPLSMTEAKDKKDLIIARPGVYVYWHPKIGVIKVGRNFTNSRKRALEHVRDNTGGKMKELAKDHALRLLLFNIKRDEDLHWVAALEVFFELRLEPDIRSERLG